MTRSGSRELRMSGPLTDAGPSVGGRKLARSTVILLSGIAGSIVLVVVVTLGLMTSCACAPGVLHIDVMVEPAGSNWSLNIVRVPVGISPDNLTLTLRAGDSVLLPMDRIPLSHLTEPYWTTYSAVYEGTSSGRDVAAGDRILLSMTAYPAGSEWNLATAIHGSVSRGTLA